MPRLGGLITSADTLTQSLGRANVGAQELREGMKLAAQEVENVVEVGKEAARTITKETGRAVEDATRQVGDFRATADASMEQWRLQTNSLVGITLQEAIENLEAGGGEMEAVLAEMLRMFEEGKLSAEELRRAVREMGSEALAVINALPLDQALKDVEGLGKAAENLARQVEEFRRRAQGAAEEMTDTTRRATEDLGNAARNVQRQAQEVSASMSRTFKQAKEDGVDALQTIGGELTEIAADIRLEGVVGFIEQINREQSG